jgi:Trypsin-co-occurring domain 1
MSEIVRFDLKDGAGVLVEVDDDPTGIVRASRGQDGVLEAGRRLTDALASVRDAAGQSISVLRSLGPDGLELEFGVKLTAEAGAVIAKTAAEGHFTVKLSWSAGDGGRP